MLKFKIVVVSKDDNFSMQLSTYDNVEVVLVKDNKTPLTKVYNDNIDGSFDYNIFMHADVSLDLNHLLAHIEECKDKYDVIGLCGCSRISVSQTPFNWFCGSRPYPETRWGYVVHGELSNQTSYFSSHSPDVFDHEVACIDGLCIAISKHAIDAGLRFDEKFEFDLYDTDLSFQCVMKYGLRLGVLVEKSLRHYSVGKSILTDNFLMHEIDFRRKWNFDIPKNTKIDQLANS